MDGSDLLDNARQERVVNDVDLFRRFSQEAIDTLNRLEQNDHRSRELSLARTNIQQGVLWFEFHLELEAEK